MALEPTPVYTNRLQCCECGRVSRDGEHGWAARLTCDDEVVLYCPECDKREFGGREVPPAPGGLWLMELTPADGRRNKVQLDLTSRRSSVVHWQGREVKRRGTET